MQGNFEGISGQQLCGRGQLSGKTPFMRAVKIAPTNATADENRGDKMWMPPAKACVADVCLCTYRFSTAEDTVEKRPPDAWRRGGFSENCRPGASGAAGNRPLNRENVHLRALFISCPFSAHGNLLGNLLFIHRLSSADFQAQAGKNPVFHGFHTPYYYCDK